MEREYVQQLVGERLAMAEDTQVAPESPNAACAASLADRRIEHCRYDDGCCFCTGMSEP